MKITLVDKNDNVIGEAERGMERDGVDIYRVSALWLVNSRDELLVVRRAYTKAHHPGRLACSVAGTVEVGETYLSNVEKEAEEELGVTGVEFEELFKDFRDGQYLHFTMWYVGECDLEIGDFKADPREVAEIFWMKYEDVVQDLKDNPDGWVGAGKSLEYMGEWIKNRRTK